MHSSVFVVRVCLSRVSVYRVCDQPSRPEERLFASVVRAPPLSVRYKVGERAPTRGVIIPARAPSDNASRDS